MVVGGALDHERRRNGRHRAQLISLLTPIIRTLEAVRIVRRPCRRWRWRGLRGRVAGRLGLRLLADVENGAHAALLEHALHALDRVSVAVQKMTDDAQKLDIIRTIIAAAAAALQGTDLRKTRLQNRRTCWEGRVLPPLR